MNMYIFPPISMKPYEIVPARLSHARNLAANLREGDRVELEASGIAPRHTLYRFLRDSSIAQAATIGSQTAAMWGCTSPFAAPIGEMWLYTAHCIESLPLAYFREIRNVVREMLLYWPELHSAVAADYEKAIRFLKMVGFEIGVEPVNVGGVDFLPIKMER